MFTYLVVVVTAIIILDITFGKKKRRKESRNRNSPANRTLSFKVESRNSRPSGAPKHHKVEYLSTESERRFLAILKSIVDVECDIHCQVPLITLATPVDFRDRSKSWAKRLDYVVTDKNTKIIAAIELDDKSHNSAKRISRDQYVEGVLKDHHSLVRFKVQRTYQLPVVAAKLKAVGIPINSSFLINETLPDPLKSHPR